MKRKRPSSYFGFPVLSFTGQFKKIKNKGVAIILAILLSAVVVIFSTDLIIVTQVSLQLASKHRDNIKAEYMAKSAFNLSTFLLLADFGVDWFLKSDQSPLPQDPKDSLSEFWSMLNGLPIGGETVEMLAAAQESFDLSAVNDEDVLGTLKLFDGQFVLNISDESSKVNVNLCSKGQCVRVLAMLEALFSCPAEFDFLEAKQLKPAELTYRIKDWVDKRGRAEAGSGFNDEDEPYLKHNPPYKAKNGPFYSTEELRLIEGWDDDVHAVFSPYITAYPYQEKTRQKPTININTAPKALLACLLPNTRVDCSESFAINLKKRASDNTDLATSPQALKQVLQETFCTLPNAENNAPDKDPTNWFDVRSDVYRIETTGIVGDQERKIVAVIERRMPDVKKKENYAYRLLDYKLY